MPSVGFMYIIVSHLSDAEYIIRGGCRLTLLAAAAVSVQAQLRGFKEISGSVPTSLQGKSAAPDGGSGEKYG
jgi:hypothetical protein